MGPRRPRRQRADEQPRRPQGGSAAVLKSSLTICQTAAFFNRLRPPFLLILRFFLFLLVIPEKIVYNKNILETLLMEMDTVYSSIIDLHLEKEVLLIDAYESATIEGARTTIDEVKHILVNNKDTKDTYMVKDTLAASKLAYSSDFKINLDGICDIWKIVTQNAENSKVRKANFEWLNCY